VEWLKRWLGKSERSEQVSNQARALAREVWEAHRDWKAAEQNLNEAVEPDQIDYAIYMREATERRFNMLMREAREQELDMSEFGFRLSDPIKNTIDM